jgi:hypothetical protein
MPETGVALPDRLILYLRDFVWDMVLLCAFKFVP